tara:strand:- start:398 stop:514 length:117 start_codon:yes stop_codon:yes gene_type:complete
MRAPALTMVAAMKMLPDVDSGIADAGVSASCERLSARR